MYIYSTSSIDNISVQSYYPTWITVRAVARCGHRTSGVGARLWGGTPSPPRTNGSGWRSRRPPSRRSAPDVSSRPAVRASSRRNRVRRPAPERFRGRRGRLRSRGRRGRLRSRGRRGRPRSRGRRRGAGRFPVATTCRPTNRPKRG